MRNGIQKRIFPILLSLILILNLILIPEIYSQAASYSAETSFTYNYEGYDYQFYFSGSTSVPDGYRFDSSALDFLLQKSAEGINIAISSGIGAKINNIFNSTLTTAFNLYRNFMIATDKLIADWIVWSDIYGFEFQFTGLDPEYPGFETYGSAYGWRFSGWMGEDIDLVLDSQGMLYGSNPIGNYTFSDDQLDFGRWSIHQYEAQGGQFWLPEISSVSFSDLKQPYIIGKSMYFFPVVNGVEHEYIIDDFVNVVMSGNFDYNDLQNFLFYKIDGSTSTVNLIENNQIIVSSGTHNGASIYYQGPHKFNNNFIYYYGQFNLLGSVSLNYPAWYGPIQTGSGDLSYKTIYANNYIGLLNDVRQSGYGDIFLGQLSTSPLPDPIVLPVDDPIPVSDIEPDPIDFDPDPDVDPDPVPGIDYPDPGPLPWPTPPIPTIVSGNDDLWPDLNLTFELEDDLIGFANPLRDFEWPSFDYLISDFTSSIVWVSAIMTSLFEGSDYHILFSVLSVFFIAASLLGLYKWWHK